MPSTETDQLALLLERANNRTPAQQNEHSALTWYHLIHELLDALDAERDNPEEFAILRADVIRTYDAEIAIRHALAGHDYRKRQAAEQSLERGTEK